MYKHSLDLIFYMLGGPLENELMLHSALSAFMEAVHLLLRNQVEKRAVLENLDCVILCLDETIDDGCVFFFNCSWAVRFVDDDPVSVLFWWSAWLARVGLSLRQTRRRSRRE